MNAGSTERTLCDALPKNDVHYTRWVESWRWIASQQQFTRIIDMGGESPFSTAMRKAYPNIVYDTTGERDLRYPIDIPGPYDLCLCMEVLEHLRDQDMHIDEWRADGVVTCLKECARLAPVVFITTPNLACWHGLRALMNHYNPYMYAPHTYEMTRGMLNRHCTAAGLKFTKYEAIDVWNGHNAKPIPGISTEGRGDCQFAMCASSTFKGTTPPIVTGT